MEVTSKWGKAGGGSKGKESRTEERGWGFESVMLGSGEHNVEERPREAVDVQVTFPVIEKKNMTSERPSQRVTLFLRIWGTREAI
jgi:hypothetical protein